MKRCPTCNQEFTDDWLTFCTQDGTSLIPVEDSSSEPPVTLVNTSMPPSVSPLEQPTLDFPGRGETPAPYSAPQGVQDWSPPPAAGYAPQGWTPPPPPAYATSPQQTLAVTSLVLGIVSVTIGFCCYFGILTAPVALVLGIYSLIMAKREPNKYGGKGFAIGGIVTGSLYFVGLILIMILYGLGALMGGLQ